MSTTEIDCPRCRLRNRIPPIPDASARCARCGEPLSGVSVVTAPVTPGPPISATALLTTVGGYRLLRPLGEGGMGTVFLAEDAFLGRQVAVKLIRTQATTHPEARARFVREAKTLASLSHENIVPVLNAGEDAGVLYLVMPLLKGESLAARLRRSRLSVAETIEVGVQLADAIAYAHAASVVHRDIKPANVWIDDTGRAMLLDFGLARTLEQGQTITNSDAVLGTPAYMSPEQARGERAGPASDIYSLGCVLYECLTGRRAFTAESPLALLRAVETVTPVSPNMLAPDCPFVLSELVMGLLSKSPSHRPASADDVRRLLRRVVEPPPRPVQRSPIDPNRMQPPPMPTEGVPAVYLRGLIAAVGLTTALATAWFLLLPTGTSDPAPTRPAEEPGIDAHAGNLAEVLKEVPAGSRIRLRPGAYAETLILNKSVTIAGPEAGGIVFRPQTQGEPTLTIRAAGVTILNVAFAEGRPSLITVRGAKASAIFRRCKFVHSETVGMTLDEGARAELDECLMTGHKPVGIVVRGGSELTVKAGTSFTANGIGIDVRSSKALLTGVSFAGHGTAAISASDRATVTLADCKFDGVSIKARDSTVKADVLPANADIQPASPE